MNNILVKIGSLGLFFLFIFLSGFWLSRSGKPYHFAVLNIHKLIALGAVVFLSVTANKIRQESSLSSIQIIAIAVTALCFIITIVTGGLLSISKAMPAVVSRLHQITPLLTLLSTSASLYYLLAISREVTNTGPVP